ncbi:MAG: hypothetical protein ACFFDN_42330, partial [Candidatus Hodarchaeota archaeon]
MGKKFINLILIFSFSIGIFGISMGIFYIFQPDPINPIILGAQIPEDPVFILEKPFSSNLPIMIINTYGQSIPDEPKITANMKIIHNGPSA